MSLTVWRNKTSSKKIDLLAEAVLNKTRYAPHWDRPKVLWDVLASRRVGDFVILLCKQDDDYAVFTDLLMPKSIPSDKFYGNLRTAIEAYVDIVIDEFINIC